MDAVSIHEQMRLEAFFRNGFVASAFIWLPIIVYFFVYQLVRQREAWVRVVSPLTIAFAICAFFWLCDFSWNFRRGFLPTPGTSPDVSFSTPEAIIAGFKGDVWSLVKWCGLGVFLGMQPVVISYCRKPRIGVRGTK